MFNDFLEELPLLLRLRFLKALSPFVSGGLLIGHGLMLLLHALNGRGSPDGSPARTKGAEGGLDCGRHRRRDNVRDVERNGGRQVPNARLRNATQVARLFAVKSPA